MSNKKYYKSCVITGNRVGKHKAVLAELFSKLGCGDMSDIFGKTCGACLKDYEPKELIQVYDEIYLCEVCHNKVFGGFDQHVKTSNNIINNILDALVTRETVLNALGKREGD